MKNEKYLDDIKDINDPNITDIDGVDGKIINGCKFREYRFVAVEVPDAHYPNDTNTYCKIYRGENLIGTKRFYNGGANNTYTPKYFKNFCQKFISDESYRDYNTSKAEKERRKEELNRLEEELVILAQQDKKTWVDFYKVMEQVQKEELYKETAHTFTQWVKNFSTKCGLHESSLWNRLKAGKVYRDYQKTQEARGVEVKPLEDIDVSVDSLVLLDKINRKSQEKGAELVDKVLNKELSRQDLRETYKLLGGDQRPSIQAKKQAEAGKIDEQEEIEVSEEEKLTAAKIVESLKDEKWLNSSRELLENKRFVNKEDRLRYETFTEFGVWTATTKTRRRIDVLAVENLTTEHTKEIYLHGIEIKVSKSDLTRDTKYMEYAPFVDYLWLAVPKGLVSVALETKADNVGIISIGKRGGVKIHTTATKLEALGREKALVSLVLRTV